MTVFEYDGRLLIVDCGVLFPEDHQPGVDLILPDFDPIRDRLDDVEALVLTHGHEDHIGAMPYLLRERRDIPLVGSKLTLALLDGKLREHRLTRAVHARGQGGRPDAVRPVRPASSSRSTTRSPTRSRSRSAPAPGMVLHTGDFKMDQLPLDGRITDLRAFARLGEEGVDLFLTDSTNAEVPGFTTVRARHRAGARPGLPRAAAADHRGLLRLPRAPRPAGARRRRRARPQGRVRRPLDGAQHGASPATSATSTSRPTCSSTPRSSADLPPEQVVLISTGSQGEPMSRAVAGSRSATTTSSHIEEGDTVVLASSLIPGNENAVYRVINGLTRWGANVVHKGNALVHVSGHASAGELLYCYNIVQPRNVMPVHGEIRHLRRQRRAGRRDRRAGRTVVIAEDGVVVDLVDGVATIAGKVDCGYVFVDGSSVGDITESDLKDRRILGEEGFISVIVVVDSVTGKVVARPGDPRPRLRRGRRDLRRDQAADHRRARPRRSPRASTDTYQLQQIVRRVVGRWVNQTRTAAGR